MNTPFTDNYDKKYLNNTMWTRTSISAATKRRTPVTKDNSEKIRQHLEANAVAAKSIKAHPSFLTKEIEALDSALDELVEDDDEFRHKAEILQGVPGAGKAKKLALAACMRKLLLPLV